MERLIGWFVANRVAANVLFFGLAAAGLWMGRRIPQETIPDFDPSFITVRAPLPGAGPAVVEAQLVARLEEAVREVEGIEEVVSVAAAGRATLTIEARRDADANRVLADVEARIAALDTLPADAEEPIVGLRTPHEKLFDLVVHGAADERSLREAAYRVQDLLLRVPGVARVERVTGREYEIAIEVAEERLRRHRLSFDAVARAVREASVDVPGGEARAASGDVLLRTDALATDAAGFARIPLIARPHGGVVRIGDVAEVRDGFVDQPQSVRVNGEPGLMLLATAAPGVRVPALSRAARRAIAEAPLPEGIGVVLRRVEAEVLESRLSLLVRNGLSGVALIVVVLMLFLSTRVALWTAAGLPFSILATFLAMAAAGVSVNMLTLFGFIVTLGLLVDDAIIVGENIERRSREPGAAAAVSAVRGAREVLMPVTFGVLTTIAAFSALFGLSGIFGELIRNVPWVVIPCLLFSLLDAAVILPHHLARGTRGRRENRRLAAVRSRFRAGMRAAIERIYVPALAACLRHRLIALSAGSAVLLLTLGMVAGGWIRFDVVPRLEDDAITVEVRLPEGVPFARTREVMARLEQAALEVRERYLVETGTDVFRDVVVLAGIAPPAGVAAGILGAEVATGGHRGQLSVALLPAEERGRLASVEVADAIRAAAGPLPHGATSRYASSLFSSGADVSVRLTGEDPGQVGAAAALLGARLAEIAGVTEVSDDLVAGKEEMVFRPRAGAAAAGVSALSIGRQIRQAYFGEEAQRLQRGRDDIRVMVRYPESDRRRLGTLAGMRIRTGAGNEVPLLEVAEFELARGSSAIRRVDGRPAAVVDVVVDAAALTPASLIAAVRGELAPELRSRFAGLEVEIVGLAGDQAETAASLAPRFALAALAIYALLAVALSSWAQPLVIMAAIPFSMVGAVWGHALMGIDLAMISVFGVVALLGIVINDALVMMDFINRARARGLLPDDAIRSAGPLRFRPIVLTSLTTFVGLVPLMFERSLQAQFLIPMAVALAYGVLAATAVTLLLVPVLYSLAQGARRG